jgi:para-aminobenzoate synthetase component 1
MPTFSDRVPAWCGSKAHELSMGYNAAVELSVIELSPTVTAPEVFNSFCGDSHAFFLDSGTRMNGAGRYSFIGNRPFLVMKSRGNNVVINEGGKNHVATADPFDVLRELLDRHRWVGARGLLFSGGVVGYFSYDLGRLIERIPCQADDDLKLPECYLCFYDRVLVFDHVKQKQYAVARDDKRALRLIDDAGRQMQDSETELPHGRAELRSNFSHKRYLEAVAKAREYIIAGEIYQVNLSQRFQMPLTVSPYFLYRRLRSINPAPFAAYLGFDDVQIVSASPERFIRLRGSQIETRPIKGTRPRGKTSYEDRRMAAELQESAKDMAENVMIVDLERNDIGRVAATGTVRVRELASLEKYPTVWHLTSIVEGRLDREKDRIDLLRAAFPGGSITGAPKIRAMEIIEELEPTRRSIYTGAIGYLGFDGGMDLNIAIRTALVKDGMAYFQSGGGIVYDSVPEEEYRETLHKAQALAQALGAGLELEHPVK